MAKEELGWHRQIWREAMSETELVTIALFSFIAFWRRGKKSNSSSLTLNSSYTRLRLSKCLGKCCKNIQSKAASKPAWWRSQGAIGRRQPRENKVLISYLAKWHIPAHSFLELLWLLVYSKTNRYGSSAVLQTFGCIRCLCTSSLAEKKSIFNKMPQTKQQS